MSLRACRLQGSSVCQARSQVSLRQPSVSECWNTGNGLPCSYGDVEDWRKALHLLQALQPRRLLEEVSVCAAMSVCTRCANGVGERDLEGSLPTVVLTRIDQGQLLGSEPGRFCWLGFPPGSGPSHLQRCPGCLQQRVSMDNRTSSD